MTWLDLEFTLLRSILCIWESFMFHLDIEHKLSKERDTHQANTVAPIWQLKEDLKSRLSEMQCHLPEESPLKSKIDPLDMLQQVGVLSLFLQFIIIVFLAFSFIFL